MQSEVAEATEDDMLADELLDPERITPTELYVLGLDCFGMHFGYLGGPLMVPPNAKSDAIFEGLAAKGFCFLDTERGQVGYRAFDRGLRAHQIIRQMREPTYD